MILYSIGHSTRTLEELASLLSARGVRTLADVRTMPKSRHVPWFNAEVLGPALGRREPPVRYAHLPALGGLRKPRPDSPNAGLRNKGFRGYADHLATDEFERGLAELLGLAEREGPLAFMCAEAVPWKCHRSILSDALVAGGHEVRHILGPGPASPHRLSPFASVSHDTRLPAGRQVTYPETEPRFL